MALTQLQVVNRALTEISRGNPVVNLTSTADGIYAATLYQGAVELLLRDQDSEFSRKVATLNLSGGTAPLGWTYEYTYPADCVRIRQVLPGTVDANDPQATRWDEGTVGGVRMIWTDALSAKLVYTTNAVTESEWDSMFAERMVRYLGSQLALPVAGRPDFSKEMLQIAGRIGSAAEGKDS